MGGGFDRLAGLEPEFGKDILGRHRQAGIDQNRVEARQVEHRAESFAGAAHHPWLGLDANRHISPHGARRIENAAVVERQRVVPGDQAYGGRRV